MVYIAHLRHNCTSYYGYGATAMLALQDLYELHSKYVAPALRDEATIEITFGTPQEVDI